MAVVFFVHKQSTSNLQFCSFAVQLRRIIGYHHDAWFITSTIGFWWAVHDTNLYYIENYQWPNNVRDFQLQEPIYYN